MAESNEFQELNQETQEIKSNLLTKACFRSTETLYYRGSDLLLSQGTIFLRFISCSFPKLTTNACRFNSNTECQKIRKSYC
jgi:hypothetical protein